MIFSEHSEQFQPLKELHALMQLRVSYVVHFFHEFSLFMFSY